MPVPKWIDGHAGVARARRARAPTTAPRTRRSRPGESAPTHESKSWTASAPACGLRDRVGGEGRRELLEQRVPDGRLAVHQRLRDREVARRLALDEVPGNGERAAAEADDRLLGRELARGRRRIASRIGADRLGRIGHPQPLDGGERPDRLARRPGPTPSTSSTPTPIATTGVMMSANITAASTPCRRTGWSVTSAVSSAERLISKNACRSRISRYSGSDRPACRMNQTGVRSTGSRRAARTSSGSTRPRLAAHDEGAARRPLGRLDARRAARRARRGRARSSSRTRAPSPGANRCSSSYHWLDDRGQPDRLGRRAHARCPIVAPGERVTVEARVRAPIPPGRYRFALDLVAEHRAWFSAARERARLGARSTCCHAEGAPHAELPAWVEPAPDWQERVAAAHAEGYARRRRSDRLAGRARPAPAAGRSTPYEPGHRAGSRASRIRSSARRCSTGSSSSGCRTSPGCPPSPRRPTSRGSTTAGSCCGPGPRARARSGSELDREPVVDPAEDERAERERRRRPRRRGRSRRRRAGRWPRQSASRTRGDRRRDEVPPLRAPRSACDATPREAAASRSSRGSASGRTTGAAPRRGCARCRGGRTFRHATTSATPATKRREEQRERDREPDGRRARPG